MKIEAIQHLKFPKDAMPERSHGKLYYFGLPRGASILDVIYDDSTWDLYLIVKAAESDAFEYQAALELGESDLYFRRTVISFFSRSGIPTDMGARIRYIRSILDRHGFRHFFELIG